jgi:hypothetical protein
MRKIVHVHYHNPRPHGRPTGFPMPTWYDKGDLNLRAVNASRKEAAEMEKRREKAKTERFRPPKNLPIIKEKKTGWWPF